MNWIDFGLVERAFRFKCICCRLQKIPGISVKQAFTCPYWDLLWAISLLGFFHICGTPCFQRTFICCNGEFCSLFRLPQHLFLVSPNNSKVKCTAMFLLLPNKCASGTEISLITKPFTNDLQKVSVLESLLCALDSTAEKYNSDLCPNLSTNAASLVGIIHTCESPVLFLPPFSMPSHIAHSESFAMFVFYFWMLSLLFPKCFRIFW